MDANPLSKTKRPKNRTQKEIVYLEKDEITQIIDKIKQEAKEQWVNRDIALVTLGITTGLRISALLNIDVSDINWQTNEIITIEKGQKTRVIKFGDKAKAALAQWLMDRNNCFGELDTDALFISQHRKRLTHEGARKLLNKYTEDLDKHITPHCLRKSCATQAYMAGAGIRTIAAQLNHNSIQTTMRYAAAVDSKKDEMIDSLDNLF
jgi:integrase/recombinase XerC